jgi:hypothetical protein
MKTNPNLGRGQVVSGAFCISIWMLSFAKLRPTLHFIAFPSLKTVGHLANGEKLWVTKPKHRARREG